MAPPDSPGLPILSPAHPLVAELGALRQQLAQYQRAAHQSAIQVQAGRLELELARDEAGRLAEANDALRKEVDVLRGNPDAPAEQPASHTLTELSLAHRRLSTKLDLTESALAAAQLELASAKHEIGRLVKAREAAAYALSELRRVEDDRLEEVEWERAERRKAEEQKRLCDLALAEYRSLVQSLDPSAVPPTLPEPSPSLFTTSHPPSPAPTASSSSESISNLLIGQRGVHQLFHDFTAALAAKERAVHALEADVEAGASALAAARAQLEAETARRVAAEAERDRAVRDDASAAAVVERYMTFSQKAHQAVHAHLARARARAAATQAGLRAEAALLDRRLRAETARAATLRRAADETGAELAREAAGRRREVALRLGMIAELERRARRVEAWLDRVRRAVDAGTKPDVDALLALLQEGVAAVEERQPEAAQRGWRKLVGRHRSGSNARAAAAEPEREPAVADSLARVAHAEDLVMALVQDLQAETEKRIELERQRVVWLAKEAEDGVGAEENVDDEHGGGVLVFDLDEEAEDHALRREDTHGASGEAETPAALRSAAPLPNDDVDSASGESSTQARPTQPLLDQDGPAEPTPELVELHAIFDTLSLRLPPLQKALHDQSIALARLRPASSAAPSSVSSASTLPPSTSSGSTTSTGSSAPPTPARRPFLSLSRRPDPVTALLDALHEVIEDARVDVEIALADEDRVCAGFEALLGVGAEPAHAAAAGGRKTSPAVLADARAYVAARAAGDVHARLARRVDDVGADLAQVKMALHELDGLGVGPGADDGAGAAGRKARGGDAVWARLELRTVAAPSTARVPATLGGGGGVGAGAAAAAERRPSGPGLFNGMRSLSSGIVRKGSGLALLRRQGGAEAAGAAGAAGASGTAARARAADGGEVDGDEVGVEDAGGESEGEVEDEDEDEQGDADGDVE